MPSTTDLTNRIAARPHAQRRGFSLLELMVVILIMGVLASIVGIGVFRQADKAKISATESQMDIVENALKLYKLSNDTYPPTGRIDLAEQEMDGEAKDGWGRRFEYFSPTPEGEYKIVSLGKDGVASEDDIIRIRYFENTTP